MRPHVGAVALSAIMSTVTVPVPAASQAALLGPGAAYLTGGMSRIATQELDERLASSGYPTFGRTAEAIGIGAYRILPSGMLLGVEGTALIVGEEPHDGREVGLGGGYATLGVGYVFALSPRARVYPRLGIGGGGLTLWIESETDSVAFDAVLANPTPVPRLREPLLSRDGLVLDVGGGVEYLPSGRGSGALIAVRLGYVMTRFDSKWDLVYVGAATDGPDATISGAYLRILLGGAWSR